MRRMGWVDGGLEPVVGANGLSDFGWEESEARVKHDQGELSLPNCVEGFVEEFVLDSGVACFEDICEGHGVG